MPEITARPTELFIPDLAYPKPLAKLIAAYNAAHETWRETYAAVVAAEMALTQAPTRDGAALVDAVAAGKAHPGQLHEQTARATLAVAEEQCRVAREHATAQTDILRSALADVVADLVPIVLANVRAAAEAHEANLEQCKAIEEASRTKLRDAMSAMRMVGPHVAGRYGVSIDWSGNAVAQPSWPVNPTTTVRSRVERLEQMVAEATRAIA